MCASPELARLSVETLLNFFVPMGVQVNYMTATSCFWS